MSNTFTSRGRVPGVIVVALVLLVAGLGAIGLHQFAVLPYVLLTSGVLVAAWLAAAMGLGYGVRRVLTQPADLTLVDQLAIGVGALMLADWCVGWAGQLTFVGVTVVSAVGWALLGWQAIGSREQLAAVFGSDDNKTDDDSDRDDGATESGNRVIWPIALGGPVVGMLLGAACVVPGFLWQTTEAGGYDVLSYHLQLPKEWIAAGAIEGYEHNAYSYLPNLVEAAYAHLGVWRGSMIEAATAAQLLHASLAIVAACAIGRIVIDVTGDRRAELLSGVIYLATPWTLVTGSMAYDEQAVMALGAAALAIVVRIVPVRFAHSDADAAGHEHDEREHHDAPPPVDHSMSARAHVGAAIVAGLLVGMATLAKLGGGVMIAGAVIVMLVANLRRGWVGWSARVVGFGVAAGAVVALWLFRNHAWTGNPVFPMLTDALGTGHWTDEQAARWNAAHTPGVESPFARLWSQGIAHLQYGYVVLPAALVAAVARMMTAKTRRRVAPMLLLGLALILGVWVALTHHQSRFLVPMLLPAVVLIGLGLAMLPRAAQSVLGGGLAIMLTLICAYLYLGWQHGAHASTAPYFIGNTTYFIEPSPNGTPRNLDSAVNALPSDAKVYAEGYARPFYIQRPIDYHTVWDASPIGPALSTGDADAAHAWLKQHGYTHMIIDWNMIGLWMSPGNYGYDPNIRIEALIDLTRRHLRHPAIYAWPDPQRPAQALYEIK